MAPVVATTPNAYSDTRTPVASTRVTQLARARFLNCHIVPFRLD